MKRSAQKAVVLAVGIAVMLIAGCEEPNLSNTRKSRLIADENRQLKGKLEQRDREIEKQKKLVEKCTQEKKDSEKQIHKSYQDLIDDSFKDFEELTRVREENKDLKSLVEQLRKEIKELKKGPGLKPL